MFIVHCQCHFCGLTKQSETMSASMSGNIGPQGLNMPDGWGIVKIFTGNYKQTSMEMICVGCLNQARKITPKVGPDVPPMPEV